jgi:hypothetical protein
VSGSLFVLSCVSVIGWVDLLTPYTQFSELQAIQRHRYSSPFLTHTRTLPLRQPYPGNGFISLTVTSNHTWILLVTVYFISCHYCASASSIQFPCSKAHILAGWRLKTQLFTSRLFYILTTPLYSVLSYLLGTDHTGNTASTVDEACLPHHCLSIDVLLFCAFAFARMCSGSRCVAMSAHVTVRVCVYVRVLTFLYLHASRLCRSA